MGYKCSRIRIRVPRRTVAKTRVIISQSSVQSLASGVVLDEEKVLHLLDGWMRRVAHTFSLGYVFLLLLVTFRPNGIFEFVPVCCNQLNHTIIMRQLIFNPQSLNVAGLHRSRKRLSWSIFTTFRELGIESFGILISDRRFFNPIIMIMVVGRWGCSKPWFRFKWFAIRKVSSFESSGSVLFLFPREERKLLLCCQNDLCLFVLSSQDHQW